MVDKTKAIEKIIDDVIENIKDKDVKEIFKTENSFYNTILNSPEFLKEHEKSLRELLPTKYDEMLCRFEKIYPDVNYFENFLKGYITLEKKIVGCSKLSDVEKIEAMSFNYTWDKPTIDWTFFRKGLENGNFTIKDIQDFCERNPEHLTFFLPLLIERGSQNVWQTLCKAIQEAAQTDTLRLCLFRAMLTTARSDALAYFIGEIEKNNYYRFKSLREVTSFMGEYDCNLPQTATK